MGKGKPKILLVGISIYAKLKQITSLEDYYYKAWLQLTEHRNFADLMKPHFQRMKI